jgi:uncharacterized membrane protein
VQRVDIHLLQTSAEAIGARVAVVSLPGTFAAPDTVLARVVAESGDASAIDTEAIARAFLIGDARVFDDDPRFGLVVLSEIASRALSPAVNDPGTAIDVIGTLVRLFALWSEPVERPAPEYDRVEVPEIVSRDMFDDAFTGIARDAPRRWKCRAACRRHLPRRPSSSCLEACPPRRPGTIRARHWPERSRL